MASINSFDLSSPQVRNRAIQILNAMPCGEWLTCRSIAEVVEDSPSGVSRVLRDLRDHQPGLLEYKLGPGEIGRWKRIGDLCPTMD